MELLLQYILKLSISLVVVFLFYQFVLRRLTFYNWNRWYLVTYSLLCFFIPFIDISLVLDRNEWEQASIIKWVPAFESYSTGTLGAPQETAGPSAGFIIGIVLLTGMAVMLIRLVIQLFSFRKMVKKAEWIPGEGMNIYQINEAIIPFSFGNSIFINQSLHSDEDLREIIRHEFVHVKQRHSVDIIWSEFLCLVNWFNPFAWLIRRAIRQNLEFIADHKVLENGLDRKQYQYLLLKVIGNNQFSIASKFNFSSLKKRIAMMNKMKSAGVHLVKFLFILPLVAVLLVAFRNNYQDLKNATNPSSKPLRELIYTDTVPAVKVTNTKGNYIDIKGFKGECMVVVKDKDGKLIEQVSLNEWKENAEKFEEKYGEILPPPPPDPPATPVAAVAPVAPVAPTEPVQPSELVAPIAPIPPIPPVKCCNDCPTEGTPVYLPVAIGHGDPMVLAASKAKGQTVLAPMAAGVGGVTIVDDYGYAITGKEDVLVKITSKTTKEELDQYKIKMKEKGIELTYDEIEYDSKGRLVKISGHMKSADGRSNFVASDFDFLVLAMINKGEQTYFKVSTKDREVI